MLAVFPYILRRQTILFQKRLKACSQKAGAFFQGSLWIILHAVNSYNISSVQQTQAMKHHMIRNRHISQFYIGDYTPLSDLRFIQNIAVFQICSCRNPGTLAHVAVMRGIGSLFRRGRSHLLFPVQEFIIFHVSGHKPAQLRGCSEMDKFCGRQAQQLHGIRRQHLPYFPAAGEKLIIYCSFRGLPVILF